jgi:glutamyl-tRNA reductase
MIHSLGTPSSAPPIRTGVDALRVCTISHRTAPLADLELMALGPAAQGALRADLAARGIPSVLLTTCNRTELYWSSRGPEDDAAATQLLTAAASNGAAPRHESFHDARALDVVAHLFRVTAGLESLVVGESEILGQVREAIEIAERDGAAGMGLPHLFRAALRFGGLARTETRIGVGALSIASSAVQLLGRVHEDLGSSTVLVIGAGMTGLKAARHLKAERVGRIVLLNRTAQKSSEAAAELGIESAPLERLADWLARADAVIAAAQVESPLVTAEMLRQVLPPRRERTLALIDLSLPRAIAPECASHAGVVLHDLSGFEQIVAYNRARREREIPRVEALLERELRVYETRARESSVRPLVAELRQRAEEIRREELERALRKDGAVDLETLDRVTRRLVDRLLQVPSQALRRGDLALDPQHAGYLRTLFGLEGDARDDAGPANRASDPRDADAGD